MAFDLNYLKKFDFGYVLKFATSDLFRQKQFLSQMLLLTVTTFGLLLFGLLSVASFFLSFYFFITPEYSGLTLVSLIIGLVSLLLVLWLSVYFSYKLTAFALKSSKKKAVDFSLKVAVKMILLGIAAFFVSLFSLYELKWLIVGIVGFVLLIFGIAITANYSQVMFLPLFGLLGILAGGLLLLAYYIILVRNFVRVSFSSILLIEKNRGIIQTIKESWEITSGKAVLIFIMQLIFTGIVYVVQQIFMLPFDFIDYSLLADPLSAGGLTAIGLILFAVILLIISMVFSEIVVIFGEVAVYCKVAAKRK